MGDTTRGARPVKARPTCLSRSFFARPTLEVARDLLGVRLVRQVGSERLVVRLVEVEAYIGTEDTACHAARGRTPRNAVMFGPAGHAYVYFTYGMHWMLNIVTEAEGFPAAVLLRAGEPLEGLEAMLRHRHGRGGFALTAGPARLCQALAIDRGLNAHDLTRGEELFLESGEPVAERQVARTPRVGIDYAAARDRRARWRILLKGSRFVSRRAAAASST